MVLDMSGRIRLSRSSAAVALPRGRASALDGDDASAFDAGTLRKDALAGVVTGLVAIPLTVGICLMSDYPVKVGLVTVIAACLVSFVGYQFRPGNHIGVPGIAAGLAPVLALGVKQFGMGTMPFLIFLTGIFQMVVWRYRLEKYLLRAVPRCLIEGLLAGVGLKIMLKFLP